MNLLVSSKRSAGIFNCQFENLLDSLRITILTILNLPFMNMVYLSFPLIRSGLGFFFFLRKIVPELTSMPLFLFLLEGDFP